MPLPVDGDLAGAGVQAVFHHFFQRRGRALYDLAGGDLVDQVVGQFADAFHALKLCVGDGKSKMFLPQTARKVLLCSASRDMAGQPYRACYIGGAGTRVPGSGVSSRAFRVLLWLKIRFCAPLGGGVALR